MFPEGGDFSLFKGGGADTYIDVSRAYLNVIICTKENVQFINSTDCAF